MEGVKHYMGQFRRSQRRRRAEGNKMQLKSSEERCSLQGECFEREMMRHTKTVSGVNLSIPSARNTGVI